MLKNSGKPFTMASAGSDPSIRSMMGSSASRMSRKYPGFLPKPSFHPANLRAWTASLSLPSFRHAKPLPTQTWSGHHRCGRKPSSSPARAWAAEARKRTGTGHYFLKRARIHPLTIPLAMSNAGASHISMCHGIKGPVFTISTACASSAHALGHAFWMVRSGQAPLAIAGGSEAPLFLGGLKAWEALRVVSKDTCRPFSRDRSGMILGEGAAMFVLEPLQTALARGVQPMAEIVGFGMSSDAGHITEPSCDGAARAMRSALDDSGLACEQVGYINAHGTATEANDRTETAAIRAVFGSHAEHLAISSTKSMHGHTLGAAGALEAAAAVLALKHAILPPTANYTIPDPACDLDVIPNSARPLTVDACLSNSFAFGGMNAVLAFRRL